MSEAIYNNLEHWENMNPAEILQDIRKLPEQMQWNTGRWQEEHTWLR